MLSLSPGLAAYLSCITLLAGLCAGSFALCAAQRALHGQPIARGRSHCPLCGHTLAARELVPLFSWLWQRGRCRACGAPIPLCYPLSEGLCAAAFLSALYRLDVTVAFVQYCILAALLIAVSFADWEAQLIPDRFLLLIGANWLLFTLFTASAPLSALGHGVLNALPVAVALLVLVLVADKVLGRESMGGGDIKLLFVLGLYFPWQGSLLILLTACVVGLVFALVAAKADKPFPFGPALCVAAWLVFLWGEPVIRWYGGFF